MRASSIDFKNETLDYSITNIQFNPRNDTNNSMP